MVWVRKGSIERFNDAKFGERGLGVWESEASVGGCDA